MVRNVTPSDAHELMTTEGYCYLDVRTEEEFATGHAAGALNIPVVFPGMMPNREFLAIVEATFSRDIRFVVGCASGARSARAAGMLAQAGYQVVNIDGGFSGRFDPFGSVAQPGWVHEGLPLGPDDDDDATYASIRARAVRG